MSGAARKRQNRNCGSPKPFVLSFRVDAQEWEALKEQTEAAGTSISKLLRASLSRLLREGSSSL